QMLQNVDERRGSWLQESTQAFFSSARVVTEPSYVVHLVRTMVGLAAHGHCVIVGRGAALILPMATTLRVRLVAPLAERIRRTQERMGLSRAEATAWVKQTDRDRADFVRTHFQHDAADPGYYDIVLNTARFGVEGSADLIGAALQHMEAQARPTVL